MTCEIVTIAAWMVAILLLHLDCCEGDAVLVAARVLGIHDVVGGLNVHHFDCRLVALLHVEKKSHLEVSKAWMSSAN